MRSLLTLLVLSVVLAACQGQGADEPVAVQKAAIEQPPPQASMATLGTFEAYWPQRTAAESGTRIATLASEMLAAPGLSTAPFQAIATAHASDTNRWSENVVVQGAHLHVEYYPSRDDLRIDNIDAEANVDTNTDIGEAGAKGVVNGVLDSLHAAGVVDRSRFDLSKAEVGYTQKGEGWSTDHVVSQIIQYRFTLMREINGINFAHAGLQVVVHRNGQIVSIRLGGAEVRSVITGGVEQPQGTGTLFSQTVSAADVLARHMAAKPDSRAVKSDLAYVFPDGEDSGHVEAMQMISYARGVTMPDGRIALAKVRRLGYSLRDATAAPKELSGVPSGLVAPQPLKQ
jgi:hypothetical protein